MEKNNLIMKVNKDPNDVYFVYFNKETITSDGLITSKMTKPSTIMIYEVTNASWVKIEDRETKDVTIYQRALGIEKEEAPKVYQKVK